MASKESKIEKKSEGTDETGELIPGYISEKLYPYQISHLKNMLNVICFEPVAFDGSDTGTGKTYTNVPLCKYLDYSPFVVCPLSALMTWKRVCAHYGVKPLLIVNYETLREGKMYSDPNFKNRVPCPYIRRNGNNITWDIPKKTMMIFDEAHVCANPKT